MRRNGAIFAFEGPDGVGKTTLVSALQRLLSDASEQILGLSFPGSEGGTLGAHIYDLHHRPALHNIRALTPDSLQVLHIAAHIDAIQSLIRPHVEKGGIVLLDRYWWSTWVYGHLAGVHDAPLQQMIELERTYWAELAPATIFLLHRSTGEIHSDDRLAFCERSRAYDALAEREKDRSRIVRVNNCDDIDNVASTVLQTIREVLDTPPPKNQRRRRRDKGHPLGAEIPLLPYDGGSESARPEPRSQGAGTLTVWTRLAPAKPTVVFDTYWRFAAERQAIFFRRLKGSAGPWTEDPILARYKFTNAYRASDRVSQFLIRRVIYTGDQSPRELFFRTLLFKFFNRIETWQRLTAALGELTIKTFSTQKYDKVLTAISASGETLYSGAYIMPSGGAGWRQDRKHRMHLQLLEYMLSEHLPERVAAARTMREAFELLKSVPTLGDFLAYQYVTDLNYSTATDFSEGEFVVPGPGARDGIRKCFTTLGGLTEAELIRFVHDRQEGEFESRALSFESLWGRSLQLIDCQNIFCEVDKYARVFHPDVKGKSSRARIKQQFRPTPTPVAYWYPPKWGLNEYIRDETDSKLETPSPDERHRHARHQ